MQDFSVCTLPGLLEIRLQLGYCNPLFTIGLRRFRVNQLLFAFDPPAIP